MPAAGGCVAGLAPLLPGRGGTHDGSEVFLDVAKCRQNSLLQGVRALFTEQKRCK
jgi:hypothetical protein